eukprot:3373365-Amphidinium_carterae.1
MPASSKIFWFGVLWLGAEQATDHERAPTSSIMPLSCLLAGDSSARGCGIKCVPLFLCDMCLQEWWTRCAFSFNLLVLPRET